MNSSLLVSIINLKTWEETEKNEIILYYMATLGSYSQANLNLEPTQDRKKKTKVIAVII